MLALTTTNASDVRREIMPPRFLYSGRAGVLYQHMLADRSYARLRSSAIASVAAALAGHHFGDVACMGAGDWQIEDALLRQVTADRLWGIDAVPTEHPSRRTGLIAADFSDLAFDFRRRPGDSLGTLLGYTLGNLADPRKFLRSAGRFCDVLVLDTPVAHHADPRLRGDAWSSAEKAWLDAAQVVHHGAVWPVTTSVRRSEDGYLIRLLARNRGWEVELIRFLRMTQEGWAHVFRECGWVGRGWLEQSPPRMTWLLEAEALDG